VRDQTSELGSRLAMLAKAGTAGVRPTIRAMTFNRRFMVMGVPFESI
jgi:hypothetical protein